MPSVVRAVHQDESPGRRLFYYANTRRFRASQPGANTLNCVRSFATSQIVDATCHPSISWIGPAVTPARTYQTLEMRFSRFTSEQRSTRIASKDAYSRLKRFREGSSGLVNSGSLLSRINRRRMKLEPFYRIFKPSSFALIFCPLEFLNGPK